MENKFKKKLEYILIFLLPFMAFLLGYNIRGISIQSTKYQDADKNYTIINQNLNFNQNMNSTDRIVDMSIFWYTFKEIEDRFIFGSDLNYKNLVYGAIKGLVNSLDDPYSYFMDPEETKQFTDDLMGSLQGIGAEIKISDAYVTVVSIIKGSPAEKANLKPKDIIYKIDDQFTVEISLYDAVHAIRGDKGTKVKLSIIREGVEFPFDVEIIRDEIIAPSVSYEYLDENNEYVIVYIYQFGDNTIKELNAILFDEIIKNTSLKGLIIDLRYNGGGYLDGAVDLASIFMREGIVVIQKKRNIGENSMHVETIRVNGRAKIQNLPLVVLVNEGTASASEIVAASFQYYDRAKIVGTQTFGKGTVQEYLPLPDSSSLRLTVSKWYAPNDLSIDKNGITPDYIVKYDFDTEEDEQLIKALEILKSKNTVDD